MVSVPILPSKRRPSAHLTGLNFEGAEQFGETIAAYQAVLRQLSERTPVKEAGERLKALRQAHPEAFSSEQMPAQDQRKLAFPPPRIQPSQE